MMRDGFLFRREYLEEIEDLPESEQAGAILAICRYALRGDAGECGSDAARLLRMMRPLIDLDCKRRENGKKGGRPKKKAAVAESATSTSADADGGESLVNNHGFNHGLNQNAENPDNENLVNNHGLNHGLNQSEGEGEEKTMVKTMVNKYGLNHGLKPKDGDAGENLVKTMDKTIVKNHGLNQNAAPNIYNIYNIDNKDREIDVNSDNQINRDNQVNKDLPPKKDKEGVYIYNPPIAPPLAAEKGKAGKGASDSAQDARFAEFWAVYPKKQGKGAARAAWKKVAPDAALHDRIMAAVLDNAANNPQWGKDGGQYIPNPATWLNQERWEDGRPWEDVRPNAGAMQDINASQQSQMAYLMQSIREGEGLF